MRTFLVLLTLFMCKATLQNSLNREVRQTVNGDDGAQASGDDDANSLIERDEWTLPNIPQDTNETASLRKKRGIYKKTVRTWDNNEIPYEIGNIPPAMVPEVGLVMDLFERDSCVNFIGPGDSNYNAKKAEGYLKIVEGGTCSSKNGKVVSDGAFQELKLNDYCNERVIIHELLHTVGIKHEHRRPDRDQYIKIKSNKINPTYTSQFTQESEETAQMDRPYDISSIMHYSQWSYGKTPTSKTIKLKEKMYIHTQGGVDNLGGNVRGRYLLSHRDKATVNKLYNCDANCGGKSCENAGYVDKNCVCVCRLGFTGDSCETFDAASVGHDDECGAADRDLTGSVTLAPPQYTANGKTGFKSGVSCFWRFKVGAGQKIKVKVNNIDIDKKYGTSTKKDGDCKASVEGYPNNYPDWLHVYLYGSEVDIQPISCIKKDIKKFKGKWSETENNELFVRWTSVQKTDIDFLTGADVTYNPAEANGWELGIEPA